MAWAMEQQIVSDASARHVLLCLANYADQDGKAAFPSTAKLEKDTGLSESTIRRKLDSLETLGMIAQGNQAIVAAYIDRADKRPICYDIQMKKPGVTVNPRSERGVMVTATGCHGDADGVSPCNERGVTVTPNTSPNPSINPSLKAEARATRLPADWKPSDSDVSFCRQERPDLLPTQIADQFRDYWIAQPGAKGRKMDWPATWRNWVRNQRATSGPRQIHSFHDERAETIAALTGRNRYEHESEATDQHQFRIALAG
jgi:hypothetical protein